MNSETFQSPTYRLLGMLTVLELWYYRCSTLFLLYSFNTVVYNYDNRHERKCSMTLYSRGIVDRCSYTTFRSPVHHCNPISCSSPGLWSVKAAPRARNETCSRGNRCAQGWGFLRIIVVGRWSYHLKTLLSPALFIV